MLSLAGLAVANVMMPVVVKRYFPQRVGFMTGVYSMGISIGTGSAAAVTAPLSNALSHDWRWALGAWALPAALAMPCWLPFLRDRLRQPRTADTERGDRAVHPCTPMPSSAASARPWRISRSRTAWAIAIFFGLQSSEIYCSMGWLAQIFRDAHISANVAGLLLAVAMAISVPISLILPTLAGKLRSQSVLVIGLALFGLAGLVIRGA